MSYMDLFKIISKPWADVNDIKLIANCGRDSAISIRKGIEEKIIKSGKLLPKGKTIVVPMKEVIECLSLDFNYIVEMARIEQNLIMNENNRTTTYAGLSK